MSDVKKMHSMAQSFMSAGKPNKAIELYNQICTLEPNDAEAWLMQGAISAEYGHIDKSITFIKRAINANPHYPEAHLTLANIYRSQQTFNKALEHANKAIAIDPSYDEAWVFSSSIYLTQGQHLQAIQCACRALKLWPECTEASRNLVNASLTYCEKLFKLERFDEAEKICIDALELRPNTSNLYFWLGRIREMQNNEGFKTAENNYRKAIDIQPDNVHAVYQLARILEKQLDDKSAEFYFQRVIELDNNYNYQGIAIGAHAKFQIANICLRHNRNDEAINYLHNVLTIIPEHAGAKHTLASIGELPTPKSPDRNYIVSLFDQMANTFDQHLVNDLDYHIPRLMAEAISHLLGEKYTNLRVLDLGCGTGLAGDYLKDAAQYLAGIDLSPNMIKKAHEKGIYDLLVEGDIVEIMQNMDEPYDLIVSSDVLIYIGDVSNILQTCANRLPTGGLLIFSIELEQTELDYTLRKTGRYAHNPDYIYKLSTDKKFEVIDSIETKIRNDYGKAVGGMIIILRKS